MVKSMTESEYYFGVGFEVWENMVYFDAIIKRRDLAEELYHSLLREEYEHVGLLSFDKRVRLWKVEKALRDCQRLIDEKVNLI